jgi:hypothetical protein
MIVDDDFIERAFSQPARPGSGPQAGRRRMMAPSKIGLAGTGLPDPELAIVGRVGSDAVMMMGDNPALPPMPARPRLLDFFRARLDDFYLRHMIGSAKHALDAGMDEKIVLACLLHDISNGALIRGDHGYWGAQMIAPYVDEEVAWAVRYHQCLRYAPDESAGYRYPEIYLRLFGADYRPPDYIMRDAATARAHRWYMSARQVTLHDLYLFEEAETVEAVDLDIFEELVGRQFRQPEEGLGLDDSPSSHMWRTIIWPNNFL